MEDHLLLTNRVALSFNIVLEYEDYYYYYFIFFVEECFSYKFFFFLIGKCTHLVGLEPTASPSTLFLQGEEMPFELVLIGSAFYRTDKFRIGFDIVMQIIFFLISMLHVDMLCLLMVNFLILHKKYCTYLKV